MSEVRRNRRRMAQEELGFNDEREQQEMEMRMQQEQQRRDAKEAKRLEIESSASYAMAMKTAKLMDKWHLDALIGFIPGGFGDALTQMLILPFIYLSMFKVRSLPLTLAVIYNSLVDIAIGLIPFWIGNICDFFHRSYLKSLRQIVGFVEDDREVIDEVNRNAVKMGILIVVFCFIIYLLVALAIEIVEWIGSLF